jgi:hypothetical protein
MTMWLERLHDDFMNPARTDPLVVLGVALLAVGTVTLVVGSVFAAMTGGSAFPMVAAGLLLLAFGLIALGVLSAHERERRTGRVVNPTCPKCGTPPGGPVSAAGLTTCTGCRNPYFVF